MIIFRTPENLKNQLPQELALAIPLDLPILNFFSSCTSVYFNFFFLFESASMFFFFLSILMLVFVLMQPDLVLFTGRFFSLSLPLFILCFHVSCLPPLSVAYFAHSYWWLSNDNNSNKRFFLLHTLLKTLLDSFWRMVHMYFKFRILDPMPSKRTHISAFVWFQFPRFFSFRIIFFHHLGSLQVILVKRMLNWSEVLQILNLKRQLYWETMMLGLRHVFLKGMFASSAFTAMSLLL